MCGRFTLRTPPAQLVEIFELLREPELKPRYNIAPTQSVAVIRARMINARAESVATKPAFRSAFKQRRCLTPADGFYEWKKTGAKKQPYLIGLRSGEPFAFAGLWEHWGHDGSAIDSWTATRIAGHSLAL